MIIPYWTEAAGQPKNRRNRKPTLNSSRPCNAPSIWATSLAGLLRLFRKRLHPTLDWRGILQRFLENCADGDSTWTTPNRRYLYQGIYLPSRQEPRIPHIVLAVDSSGSVDNALLEMFCTELSGILESYDTLLTVLFHDTRVQSAPDVYPARPAVAAGPGRRRRNGLQAGYRLYRGKRSRPHLHDLVYRSGM